MIHTFWLLSDDTVVREVTEVKIPVPWGHVSGKWWGSRDKQPILALHGWQDNAGTWDTLIPLLPVEYSLLAIDLPGHGMSSHYPPGMHYYIFWDGISLIRRIVEHYKWGKITLMGHSLGGALSFMYAATFPDDVDRYISLDIASPSVKDTKKIVDNTGPSIDTFLKYENLKPESIPCYNYEDMLAIVLDAYKGSITEKSCEILMQRGMSRTVNKNGYHFSRDVRLKVASLGMFSIEYVLEYAKKIKCKVLNIKANPGMDWDNPQHYGMVIDVIKKHASLVVCHEVAGTHHVHLNEPEKVLPFIVNFLHK